MQRKRESKRHRMIALGLVGCVALAGRVSAQQPAAPAPEARTIRVSGVGEATARPDEALLSFAVESFAGTAREAGQQNARIMDRVVQALVASGVPRGDIETRNYSVFPEYIHEPSPQGSRPRERIRGYRATNQVVLQTTELGRVGELIDRALEAGANRVDGLSFGLRNSEPVQAEALRRAVERARASAQTIAGALGVRLGPVIDASTGVEPPRPIHPMRAQFQAERGGDLAVPTPIEPGEHTVHAHVSLVFAIESS